MAEVWLAQDDELGRQVVVKLLALKADRGRFEREGRAVAALAHPNIVQLYDFGDEERPYMVFEYLSGGTLEDRLARNPILGAGEIGRIAKQVAEGLAHAHERGVVHRDLKPGNILFDADGSAKIADFGIAQLQGADPLTDAGTVLGTAAYISPEQVRGEPATPASDVYSFGVVVYSALAGRLPFEASSVTELAALHRDAEPEPLAVDDDRRPLATLALSTLAKDPSRRPQDGAALLAALGRDTRSDLGTTRIIPPRPRRRGMGRRHLLAGLAVLLVAICGSLAAVLLSSRPTSAPAVPVTSPAHSSQQQATTTASLTESSSSSTATTTAASTAARSTTTTPRTSTPLTTAPAPLPPPSTAGTTAPVTSTTAPVTTGP
jgi:serine/threonine-protein kinase